jgi:tRNA threonylcarbamoyladenosine biosynthesis protein TsaB
MKVLAVDTSSRCGAIGIFDDGEALAELSLVSNENHSCRLLPGIEWLLRSLHLALADMDGFGVVTGPGSFTGLRVGLATVKGFAWSLGKPVVGLSSLEVLARGVPEGSCSVAPMLDARKERVYGAVFRFRGSTPEVLRPPADIEAAALIRDVRGEILCLGDGARKYEKEIRAAGGDRVRFLPRAFDLPRGIVLARMAHESLQRGEALPVGEMEPCYLRLSEAEVKAKENCP